LYPEEFFRLPIIQPPTEEQRRIVEAIQVETGDMNSAISRLEREIELLREYRTRLVADVVTGKLDVREAAERLPEEAAPATVEESVEASDEAEPADEEVAV
jgi:type I restriction enzyme S subunit